MLVAIVTSIIFLDIIKGDLYNYEYTELGDSFDDEYSVDYNTLHPDPARVRRIPADSIVQTKSNREIKDEFDHTVSGQKMLDNFTSPKRTKQVQETTKKPTHIPLYFDDEYNISPDLDEVLRPTIVHIDTWSTEDPTEIKAPKRLNYGLLGTSEEIVYDNATTSGVHYYDFAQTSVENLQYTEKALESSNTPTLQKSQIYIKITRKSPILPTRSSGVQTSSSDLTDSLYEYETYIQNPGIFYTHLPDTIPKLSSKSAPHADIPIEKLTESTYEYESYVENPTRYPILLLEKTTAMSNLLTPYYVVNKSPETYVKNIRKSSVLNGSPKFPNRSTSPDISSELPTGEKSYIFESYVQNPRRWYLQSPKKFAKSPLLPDRSPELNSEEMLYRYQSSSPRSRTSSHTPERSPKLPNRSSPRTLNRSPKFEQAEIAFDRYDSDSESPKKSSFYDLPHRSPNLPDISSISEKEEIVLYRYDSYNESLQTSYDPPHRSPKLPHRSPQLPNKSAKLEPKDMSLYRYETYSKYPRKSSFHPPRRSPKTPKSSHTPNKPQQSEPASSVYRYESSPRKLSWHHPERSPKLPKRTSRIMHEQPLNVNESIHQYIQRFKASSIAPDTSKFHTAIAYEHKRPNYKNLPKLQDNTIENEDTDANEEDYIPEILLRYLGARNNDNNVFFRAQTDDDMKTWNPNILRQTSILLPANQTTTIQPPTTPPATTPPATTQPATTQPPTTQPPTTTLPPTTTQAPTTQTPTTQTTTTQTVTTTITTPPTTVIRYDIARFLAIIANLTYDYDTNLTQQVNATLIQLRWPTCGTPAPPPTTTTTPPPPMDYSGFNGSLIAKCFVCGLESEAIPYEAHCADAFAGDFIPLVPQDPRARSRVARYRKYCRLGNVRNYHLNATYPRAIYGEWTGGCAVRWTDVTGVYTQRTCRNKLRPTTGRHFASKRMAKLEKALLHEDNGCIISPVATLLPLSRGVSLFARFHACVCTGSWCNTAPQLRCACVPHALLLVALAHVILVVVFE